ncbi:MAG: hypothetical protein V7746_12780 [Halioglobus sp.]
MKKLLALTSASVLALAAAQASAATYDVSGSFDHEGVFLTLDGTDLATPAGITDLTFGGQMITDNDSPGYNVIGGTIIMDGLIQITTNSIVIQFDNIQGTATNDGVIFDSGTICVGPDGLGGCAAGSTDVAVSNLFFDGSATWGAGFNIFPTAGLSLTGGAGGASFTVAQPGLLNLADNSTFGNAVGGADLFSNSAGLYLGGDLTFTEVAAVPVPAAAWLFGSAILGLVGIGRKRKMA